MKRVYVCLKRRVERVAMKSSWFRYFHEQRLASVDARQQMSEIEADLFPESRGRTRQ